MHFKMLFIALTFSPLTLAYQVMRIPNPLRFTINPNVNKDTVRDNYTQPLTPAKFPCKGYMSDMFSDPSGNGKPVVNYQAGKSASIAITGDLSGAGTGLLLGGSAQISISGNNGSLTVIHSFEGSIGSTDQQELDFTIPSDSPTGTAALSFTYFPLNSNDVFQSCASITIDPATDGPAPSIPFASRPDVFISDLDNSCTRDAKKELMFPNPGPDVTMNHTVPLADEVNTYSGKCAPVNGFGNGAKDSDFQTVKSSQFPGSTSSGGSGAPSSGPSSFTASSALPEAAISTPPPVGAASLKAQANPTSSSTDWESIVQTGDPYQTVTATGSYLSPTTTSKSGAVSRFSHGGYLTLISTVFVSAWLGMGSWMMEYQWGI